MPTWLTCLCITLIAGRVTRAQTPVESFTFASAFTEDVGKPTGLTLDTIDGITYLYVSDHEGGRVWRYNLTDNSRLQFAGRGSADGQFLAPDAIAVEPATHDLYIADRQLHRVTRLTRNGAFVMKWGDTGNETNRFGHPHAGSAAGQFNAPVGVALDAAGNIYTTEHENHRVQKFRVTQTATGWKVDALAAWGSGGTAPGEFFVPYGIAVDQAGVIWVADGYNSRLQKFTADGQLLGQILVRGSNEPQLVTTWLSFDAHGDIWVGITSDPFTGGDLAYQRIEKFSPTGTSLGRWGSRGSGPGQFQLPFGIVVNSATNRAYVTDYDNRRIQVFSVGTPTTPPPPPPPPPPTTPTTTARLLNLSSRQRIASADTERGAMTGFVIAGSAPRQMLIRAIGPGLATFGVADALANPRLQIFDRNGQLVADNDDWSETSDMMTAASRAGAFRVPTGSRDSALLATLPAGAYTMHVTTSSGSGVVLLEVYDVGNTDTAEKLINLSTRGYVEPGEGQLVAGFVVSGSTPKRMLIRGIGPALGAFGVSGALGDPMLRLFAAGSTTPLVQNDNWESPQRIANESVATAAEISAAASTAGAFALTPGSRDAALVITVPPGNYTAVVSGPATTTGVALIEVFELP